MQCGTPSCGLEVEIEYGATRKSVSMHLESLRITRNNQIADGIHLLEFCGQDGRELAPFDPGAHLSIPVPNGIVRKYSLCNDPSKRDTT